MATNLSLLPFLIFFGPILLNNKSNKSESGSKLIGVALCMVSVEDCNEVFNEDKEDDAFGFEIVCEKSLVFNEDVDVERLGDD